MKYLRNMFVFVLQVSLVYIIWYICDYLAQRFDLPLPGTIIGMILLFVLLQTGILKESWIDYAGDKVLGFFTFFFLPSGVFILDYMDILSGSLLKLILIVIVSTILVIICTGLTVQYVIRKDEAND